MQSIITYLMLLITGMVLQAQNTIEVSLTNFKNNDGVVMVGLYNEAGNFLETSYKSISSEIVDKKVKVTFKDVPDGTYAISSYHDADESGELNMFMGMFPTESYGCSNGARGYFGPPKWEHAKFEVKDGETRKMDIRL
ncbi:MAG: DUF2141 domain-containing protein [Bacteroidetes bacterium]|nr:DUF2141 domain-containing protein [Bacteroidota bacterium]TDI76568.1 MAG: DUF2141 domain-containing protein [Bacteroidota bacterium]